MTDDRFEIFAACAPGLEPHLAAEAVAAGFDGVQTTGGGITFEGLWPDVWRANLCLRGAGRVLARIGAFRAFHLAQLDKRARKFAWDAVLPAGARVKVETTCRKSKIYHAGAATQRIERAIADALPPGDGPQIRLMVRIDDNLCTFSIDTSGEALHKRGAKPFVGKAPMRETLAALFLRACGYDGTEPVVDPMCGSGTFVLEAAEIAKGLLPGRNRHFAFEALPTFDPEAFTQLRAPAPQETTAVRVYGYDRDQGAIHGATQNAERAGISDVASFQQQALSDLMPPDGPPGLVIVNPPYGARIGNRKLLFGLYASLGSVLSDRFSGWRVGIVTSDGGLAKATGLALRAGPPVAHGGLKVKLYQAALH